MAATPGAGAEDVRLKASTRRQMLIMDAARVFAEEGFSVNVRLLARRLNVSPALIFKYFGTKDKLIAEVYRHVYAGQWNELWLDELSDRSIPFRQRLVTFYTAYFEVVREFEWTRCGLFSSLNGHHMADTYYESRLTPLLERIAIELRHEKEEGGADRKPSRIEMEQIWHLHSSFIYYGIRKHIYRQPVAGDVRKTALTIIDTFLYGALPRRPSD